MPPREHAIRATFALAGLRREELIALRVGDANLEHPARSTLCVRGKGDKERLVPVPAPLHEILLDYMLRAGRTSPRERLYTRPDGAPLTPKAVNEMVARWGKALDLHLYPHRFRHAYATFMAAAGVAMPTLQEWMGHQDIATTAGYFDATHDTGAREALERFAGSVREPILGRIPSVTPAQGGGP